MISHADGHGSAHSGPQRPGKAPFLCAPYYVAGEDGRYEPSQYIDQCPLAEGGQLCQLEKHSFRYRKTGPEIPLRILHCKVHGLYFTVYPVGHVPYGRCSVAAVDLRGAPIEQSEPEPEASCRDVLFEAVLDAATGRSWKSEPETHHYPTQRRRIERCAQLLGMDPTLRESVAEGIRDHLGIPGLDQHWVYVQFQRARSMRERASAILDVQQRVISESSCVLRLLAAGSLSNLWGHPYLWDSRRGQRFSLLSRTSRALRAPP